MKKFLLLFHTIRYLKLQQIYWRLYRKVVTPAVTDNFNYVIRTRSKSWKHHLLYESKITIELEACFLNYTKRLALPYDWNNESLTKLWVYNLHYFEDLLSEDAEDKRCLHQYLLKCWIKDNPVGCGNGWEPYPISLRIVNILKAWLGGLELDKNILASVFAQASFLSNSLEKHLLGNHYFTNLKALLFAGVVFNNHRWLEISEEGLNNEIPEQILEDGANFELSPMYHSLALVDVLDMFNLAKAYPSVISNELCGLIEAQIPKMLAFMESMSHPDEGVAFFNDSADGIAAKKQKIESYAKQLGFKVEPLNRNITQVIDNKFSGYVCASAAGSKLIFDASPVGPDYIPGHAHADTLSFELSIGMQRVFVNSGTSEYGLSEKRLKQRSTSSHNTVEIDSKNSSEIWSGFRVGNRAKIVKRSIRLSDDSTIVLTAQHNGYKSFFGGCFHSRNITFTANSLTIRDSILGTFKCAKSRFFFHPNIVLTYENYMIRAEGENFILESDLKGKIISIVDSVWCPEFGVEKRNKVLEVLFEGDISEITFSWRKK